MSGRRLVTAFLALVLGLGALLFYTQNYAFYDRVDGRQFILVQGNEIPVEGYLGIDAKSSGLKRRGCFRTDPAAFTDMPIAEAPEPLNPPFWFDCFVPEDIATDLAEGRAKAYIAALEEQDGIDRLVAVYPDGRGFEWRQLNAKFSE